MKTSPAGCEPVCPGGLLPYLDELQATEMKNLSGEEAARTGHQFDTYHWCVHVVLEEPLVGVHTLKAHPTLPEGIYPRLCYFP